MFAFSLCREYARDLEMFNQAGLIFRSDESVHKIIEPCVPL
jgi:hypothetical protein